MKFNKTLASLSAVALLAASMSPALAQVPSISYTAPAQVGSYRATIINLAPAASATDFFTISGANGKQVQIRNIHCSGISTAAATALIQVVKRSTLDTTGTSTTLTNVRQNSGNGAAGAVVKAYTANPGALGTAVGSVDAGYLATNTLASSAINNTGLTFDFSQQYIVLNNANENLALNANAQSFSAGAALTCTVQWSEQ